MQNFLFANLPFERGKILFSMSTTMGKDIHVVSMDVETIAVIKKNKKIQHERMRQGNARIIVIHPFVFGLSIFLSLLVKSNGWNV